MVTMQQIQQGALKFIMEDFSPNCTDVNSRVALGGTGALAVAALPNDRFMIETDAPYLTPKNVPGLSRINVPENIRYVAKDLAYYMSVPQEELEKYARQNTRRFFRLPEEEEFGVLT